MWFSFRPKQQHQNLTDHTPLPFFHWHFWSCWLVFPFLVPGRAWRMHGPSPERGQSHAPCLRAGCGDLSPARCWSEKLCIYRNAITVCSCVWDASSPVKEECPVGSRSVTEHVVLFGVNPGYFKWRAGHTVDSTAVWKEPPCAGRWAASDRGLSWGWGGTQPRSS